MWVFIKLFHFCLLSQEDFLASGMWLLILTSEGCVQSCLSCSAGLTDWWWLVCPLPCEPTLLHYTTPAVQSVYTLLPHPLLLSSLTSTQAGGDKKISILSLSWEIITRQTITINIAGLIGMSHCRVIDIWVKSHSDMQYLSTQQKISLRLLSQSAAREKERERERSN